MSSRHDGSSQGAWWRGSLTTGSDTVGRPVTAATPPTRAYTMTAAMTTRGRGAKVTRQPPCSAYPESDAGWSRQLPPDLVAR